LFRHYAAATGAITHITLRHTTHVIAVIDTTYSQASITLATTAKAILIHLAILLAPLQITLLLRWPLLRCQGRYIHSSHVLLIAIGYDIEEIDYDTLSADAATWLLSLPAHTLLRHDTLLAGNVARHEAMVTPIRLR